MIFSSDICVIYIEREVEVYTFSLLLLGYINLTFLNYGSLILDKTKENGLFVFPGPKAQECPERPLSRVSGHSLVIDD